MTRYVAGQRVRIEVEGVLHEDGRESVLRILWGNGGGATFAVNGQPVHWVQDADITVLAEPRPEEPTGLGAVVEAGYGTPSMRRRFLRAEDGRWWFKDRDGAWIWSSWGGLIDPVVLSEGWMPCG